jgi:sugar phosphate isomerase/epimerase
MKAKLLSMYKHAIASVSIPETLVQKMKAVAKAGYDGIELFENDLTIHSPTRFRDDNLDIEQIENTIAVNY